MRTRRLSWLLVLVALLWTVPAFGQETDDENEGPEIHGFLRPDWLMQKVDDPFRESLRVFHFLTRSRLYVQGTYEGIRYRVELGLTGPEAEIPVSRSGFWGMPQILQDFYADIPFPGLEKVYVRLGQFKVPAGLEGLTYSAEMPFVDRSIVHDFLGLMRDYGGALHAYPGENVSLVLAVQSGLGRSIPNRYLPEEFGFPFLTARLQLGPNRGHDLFRLAPRLAGETAEVRIGANLTYHRDVVAGHSTALNVWNKEKPILLQGGWNAFVGQRPLEAGTLLIAGADVSMGFPTEDGQLWLQGQVTHGQYENDYGDVAATAFFAQGTYDLAQVGFGLRYALVSLDNLGGDRMGRRVIQEVTPMLTYRLRNNVKIILDGDILLDAPVAVEKDVGVYVLTDQPDQIGQETIERQDVFNFRAAVQVGF
ncbi:OprO/OprP family phosphate-selective porin [Rhodocaloribacter litoris]|uniref:porin n=1 Tax=Rhodocaloribacter litoris TaxID=2558931 RepID=UPI001422EF80|nr:porin [Rhodocaloribacter litoris]QXD14643.1 OprO/OprP family phosphate-selective porin [Rhodocaloribacter litoris]GIV59583.1 MAG: hypothetical protein KatS3mg043_0672 [Rhodothermaceae bacterium]